MKKNIILFAQAMCAFLLFTLVYGCEKVKNQETDETKDFFITVSQQNLTVGNTGQENAMITIETNAGWDIAASEQWIHAEKINEMTVSVSIDTNGLESPERTGTLQIIPDNDTDPVNIEITQDAGWTIGGRWQAIRVEHSSDLENWIISQIYADSGIELYYTIDLQNRKMIMSMNDPRAGDTQESELDIVEYSPEKMTFTISDGNQEGEYTIFTVDGENFEFYSYTEFTEDYSKIVCTKAGE